jgi:uncharacterized protein (DUF927 family)
MSASPAKATGWIDFHQIAAAALAASESIVLTLLPDGYRSGNEWICRNPTRSDTRHGSFKINLQTGVWADFATSDKGGDLIDLVAYVRGTSKLEAARELAAMLKVSQLGTRPSSDTRKKTRGQGSASVAASPEEFGIAPTNFLPRTPPDEKDRPRFTVCGEEGPPADRDEKRRHVYRQGGVPTRLKIILGGSRVYNLYRVVDCDGAEGWQWGKPKDFIATPYLNGSDPFATSGDDFIYWPEGEKDVDTVSNLGLPAFTFGGTGDGLPAGCDKYVVDRQVVILADNDDPGRKHAEAKAALAAKVAASVRIVHFADTPEKGDVSDWIEVGHTTEELKERAAGAGLWDENTRPSSDVDGPDSSGSAEIRTESSFELPFGYKLNSDGLYWSDEPFNEDKQFLFLSGPLQVIAETRDVDGASWGILLQWKDHDGHIHRFPLPRSMLAGDGVEARKILLDGGMYIAPGNKARNQLNSFFLQVRSPNRARATNRIGWHGDAFVLPDTCFPEDTSDPYILQSAATQEHAFRQSGTLESWQDEVAAYAVGNCRLTFAIAVALSGPLVALASAEGGGFHFRGSSSIGKTTLLHVAGSVWGGGEPGGFVRAWRATSNGLEGVALGHCDTVLCLDELSQLSPKEAGEVAYMLANGSGKSRGARDGLSARRVSKWRTPFLSSGEISLADKIAEDGRGRKLAAGQQVRVVDIPADAGRGMGIFENLHGLVSAEALARHLRAATQRHYGIACREYLAAIVPIADELRDQIGPVVKAFVEQYVPSGADGQVVRVAQRFALVAVAGELAQQHGVVPWPAGAAIAAAGRCLEDWLEARGGHGAAETRDGIEQVRSFIQANGVARFLPAWQQDEPDHFSRDIAGFRKDIGDGWDYYVTTTAWREVCQGFDPKRLATVLAERGFLDVADDGRLAKPVRVKGHGQRRLYHIRSKLLEGD